VRAMPNTPAAIGRGISVAVADKPVTKAQRDLADTLLAACGEVAWVTDEDLINPVTALSGGGPAYVFLLMEALAEAGRKAGLPADLAMRLARVTVCGAGELARLSPESAAQLRQNVTSPRGTTLEALKILMAADTNYVAVMNRIAEAHAALGHSAEANAWYAKVNNNYALALSDFPAASARRRSRLAAAKKQ